MILPDHAIRKRLERGDLKVEPTDLSYIQPASLDVRIDNHFRVFRNNNYTHIDPKQPMEGLTEAVKVGDEGFVLHPHEFVLGATLEVITMPNDLVSLLEGKSSLGRLGLVIHSTAGFIDPGFSGQITLELSNVATLPIILYPGMKIGQLSFQQLLSPAETPYGNGRGSKYWGQRGPTESQYFRNFPENN